MAEGLAVFATRAGGATRVVLETLLDENLDDLKKSRSVDLVLLNLRGAMVADGHPDAESDLLSRVAVFNWES